MQTTVIANPFTFRKQYRSTLLNITVVDRLRDRGWAAHFGDVQHALQEQTWGRSKISQCRFDFSNCSWADPTPLLSVFMALFSFCDNGGVAEVILPPVEKELGQRFLEYINQEGFLDILINRSHASRFILKIGSENISDALTEKIRALQGNLAFKDCRLLPASVFYIGSTIPANILSALDILTTPQRIDEIVENKINEVFSGEATTKISQWALPGIKVRLRTILRETLHNILEHAYGASGGYAGLYVRFRRGYPTANASEIKTLREEFKLEGGDRDVPLLPEDYANHTGFIEVFVIDAGQGICRTLSETVGRKLTVQEYILAALRDGRSSKRADKRITAAGGLKALRELLEPHGDSIRIRDMTTWWGAKLPFTEKDRWNLNSSTTDTPSLHGLAWTIRLSWEEHTDVAGGNYWREWTEGAPVNVLEEFTTTLDTVTTAGISVFDMRFADIKLERKKETSLVVWLPPVHLDKNSVISTSANLVESLANDGILIIGDISPFEASIYVSAFENLLTSSYNGKVKAVVLITLRLRVCVFEKLGDRFAPRPDSADSYLYSNSKSAIPEAGTILDYLRAIRVNDSLAFWNVVQNDLQEDPAYLKGNVEW